ncbi:MAG: hypothetical protein ACK55Z_00870, partial [bacterium]
RQRPADQRQEGGAAPAPEPGRGADRQVQPRLPRRHPGGPLLQGEVRGVPPRVQARSGDGRGGRLHLRDEHRRAPQAPGGQPPRRERPGGGRRQRPPLLVPGGPAPHLRHEGHGGYRGLVDLGGGRGGRVGRQAAHAPAGPLVGRGHRERREGALPAAPSGRG